MQQTESWLPIPGYEGYYSVSDQGRVRNARTGRVLKASHHWSGYRHVTLSVRNQRRQHQVHVLVLTAFAAPRPDGMQACHGPGGQSDNRLSNLRWDTPSENELDKVRQGTHNMASRKACPRDHLLVMPNLVACLWEKGYRDCLACNRGRTKARNARVRRGVHLDWEALADAIYAELMLEADAS